MVQANSVADPLSDCLGGQAGFQLGAFGHVAWSKLGIGLVLAFLVAMVIIGGVRRIAKVAERIVLFMAVIYVLGFTEESGAGLSTLAFKTALPGFGKHGPRAVRSYRWLYVLLIPVGAAVQLEIVWHISDIFN